MLYASPKRYLVYLQKIKGKNLAEKERERKKVYIKTPFQNVPFYIKHIYTFFVYNMVQYFFVCLLYKYTYSTKKGRKIREKAGQNHFHIIFFYFQHKNLNKEVSWPKFSQNVCN